MRVIILICVILVLTLGIRYAFFFSYHKNYVSGDRLKEKIILLSEPKNNGFATTISVSSVQIRLPQESEIHYGDEIYIEGIVEKDSFEGKNNKIISYLVVNNPIIRSTKSTNIFLRTASYIRTRISKTFFFYLPQNEAALLFGIVFGGSQDFTSDTKSSFKNAGVLHVVAASGMNVTMVASFLIAFFSRILMRRQALIIAILGVFYYALLSGFSPSIVRASIMASIAFSAGVIGRQNSGIFALFITGWLMLFFQPEIIFDIGFLLSFTSTLGIVFCKPLLDSLWRAKNTKIFSDDITTSIGSQIGSFPIIAGVFSSYSLVSIFANALVLWTIPFLMILGGIAAVCAITLPIISVPFLYIAYPFLVYFETITDFFGSFPLFEFSTISIPFLLSYYFFIMGGIIFLRGKVKKSK